MPSIATPATAPVDTPPRRTPPLQTAPITSVGPLTPHLYAPDALRPLRAKEHFLKADTLVELHRHPWPQLTFSTRGLRSIRNFTGSAMTPNGAPCVPSATRSSLSHPTVSRECRLRP
jgi:hypothetical protein